MTVMHGLISNATFDASSYTYRYRAHSFLPPISRLITTLKILVAAQWGCIKSYGSNGEAQKKIGDWEEEKWRATWEPIHYMGNEANFLNTKSGKKWCFGKRKGAKFPKVFRHGKKRGFLGGKKKTINEKNKKYIKI